MIKNYLDLIEWIRSPRNTKKDYSISLVQSCILQRLIKYSRVNENITYSNENISEHMFRSKKQIENELPILAKKNLITTKVSKSKDEFGHIITKRVIKINWDKLNEIKVEMDDFLNQDFDDGTIQLFNKEDLIQSQDNQEEMEDKTDGVVYIFKKGKEFLMKNKNDIYVRYLGIGSQLSLYYKFENEKTENYTRTLNSRFSSYLESTGKVFSELTKQDLINMSSNHSFTV